MPWEIEALNTAPAFYAHEKGGSAITASAPGLYCVSAGFFTLRAFLATVCVNGEPVFAFDQEHATAGTEPSRPATAATVQLEEARDAAAGFSSSSALVAKCGHRHKRFRHSAGDVFSCSAQEFLALPAHSVISIRFESDIKAQAFISLQKL